MSPLLSAGREQLFSVITLGEHRTQELPFRSEMALIEGPIFLVQVFFHDKMAKP